MELHVFLCHSIFLTDHLYHRNVEGTDTLPRFQTAVLPGTADYSKGGQEGSGGEEGCVGC